MRDVAEQLERLRRIVRGYGSVLVAYSGGVDSALVLAVAHQELGARALGCIGVSPSYPESELAAAEEAARRMGARCRRVETHEHLDGQYAANGADRCYFCKKHLHDTLNAIAAAEGWAVVADGNNRSDLAGEHRYGMQAAHERGVRSPLQEAGLDKEQVRAAARALGLGVWDKPSMACLSSRVPHGTTITVELLKKVEAAERALAGVGFEQYRVRHHGAVARLEVPPEAFWLAVRERDRIVAALRAVGYRHVTLDLAGYGK